MFVVKKDLMKLGFSSWQAMMLVKQAKAKLASQGRKQGIRASSS
ncbi:TPA: DUF3173 family protein [Streptococcus agalactiae]